MIDRPPSPGALADFSALPSRLRRLALRWRPTQDVQRYRLTPDDQPLIDLQGVSKAYDTAGGPFFALKEIDLSIKPGEFVAILGKSGAGKSTLVNLLTGIDRPSEGFVTVGGARLHEMGEEALAAWRGRAVGVVFQQFQLMPLLTCLENVILPMDFGSRFGSQRARRARARRLLEQMGIGDQAHKVPSAVSGGQQQRVAIARALANDPPLIVADEATGNLDSATAAGVLEVLESLLEAGKTVVIITHDREIAARADRRITLVDGRIAADESTPSGRVIY